MEVDGFILVSGEEKMSQIVPQGDLDEYLSDIDKCIEKFQGALWPLNKSIHDNPELAFKEHKTHDALTRFMCSQKGWRVTPSAYGLETAWVAAYDSGKDGPVVSFNAEMGKTHLI
jgi:metal-dependent amidase/aminoacylase/carboxypeptidase family protein